MGTQEKRYLQFGCGLSPAPGWSNFDASPTLKIQRIPLIGRFLSRGEVVFPPDVRFGDVVRGLPVDSSSCDAVYSSHVLEHLSLEDMRTALRNTYTYLKPSGVFRFVVPDLEFLTRQYLETPDVNAAHQFMENSYLGLKSRQRGIRGGLRAWIGNAKHLWMWDYKAIESELHTAGFVGIRRAKLGDSGDAEFESIEAPSRWDNCLGVECFRPNAIEAGKSKAA